MAVPTLTLGPAQLNLAGIRGGDRNQFTVTLTVGGLPMNLTGLVVAAQARLTATDVDPPDLTAVCTVTNAVGGQFTVRWPGDAVTALLAGAETWTGVWDLQVDNGVDDPLTVAAGTFDAVSDVTRP